MNTLRGADTSSPEQPLEQVAAWPVSRAAAAVTGPAGTLLARHGDLLWQTPIASVTKALVSYATLIAVEEGSVSLDQPAGPPDSTLRHLLAHTSGLPFEGTEPIAAPGRRRIYSNTGFDVLADTLTESTGIPVGTYLAEAVLQPLDMAASELHGSPAHGAWSTVADLARFAHELLAPTLVSRETLDEAVSEQFPGLGGRVPGMGRYEPNPWGLGFELKGEKSPHWTAPDGSPRTFGHFGGSGSLLWVDPDARLACVALTDRRFGDWAPPLWSAMSSDVLATFGTETVGQPSPGS